MHITTRRHSPYAPRIKTGVSWDLLIHDVDLILNIAKSDLDQVVAQARQFHPDSVERSDDVAEATLTFASGALGHASVSRVGQRKIRELSIYEQGRLIEVDLLRRDVTIISNISSDATNEGRNYRQQTVIEIPELISNREPLAAQLDHFLNLLESPRQAKLERESILPSHEVIAAVVDASRKAP